MNALRYFAKSLGSVVDGVHRSHDRQQHLRRANVAGGFFAPDMLLARLQGEAQGGPPPGVLGHPDEAPGHLPLEGVERGQISRVRTAVAERDAKALRASHHDVGSKLPGGPEQGKAQQVSRNNRQCSGCVGLFNKTLILVNGSVHGGILDQRGEDLFVEVERVMVSDHDFDLQGPGPGSHHFDGLREAALGNEEDVAALFGLEAMAHGHGFGGGRAFVEQRGVRNVHACQVDHHGLKIQERFQAALGYLGLIRSVLGVPAGVLEYVPLDDRRSDAIVIA